jgi:hypothetical protein
VMTLVLFSWLFTDPFFKDLTDINIRKDLYESQIEMIENSVAPFGFINNGVDDEPYVDSSGQSWEILDRNSNSDFL